MTPDKITRHQAIEEVNLAFNLTLINATTHFANINSARPVWWFDIPVKKFTSSLYEALDLLLVSYDAMSIYHLRVPTAYVRDNLEQFHVRNDKNSVSLELSSCNTQLFQDVRPGGARRSFSEFLQNTLKRSQTRRVSNCHANPSTEE